MNPQLTFDTEAGAIAAEKQIWIDIVKMKAAQGENLVGDGVSSYGDLSGLSDEETSQLKIYSSLEGTIDQELPLTTHYAKIKKAHELDKWYFCKPIDMYMAGVIDHTIEEYNTDWEPPEIDE